MEQPPPEAIQKRFWMLLLAAEEKRDEYWDCLRFKVDQLKRKEEGLLEWEMRLLTVSGS